MCDLLHAGGGGGGGGGEGDLAARLEAARGVLRDGVLLCLQDAAARAALSGGGLEQLPLGFETGDARVDGAARLLRLLFLRDLRALQSGVDEAVVSVQELTANPKTDSALGKVGR
ncbi:MAG: putative carnitine deficiency-associated protein-domain-containing protein [Monoraphidium minutum]|nr:MAG: putative carnitine deficiency-associated protein-domain-containing protein [Monoraphidium minutum]